MGVHPLTNQLFVNSIKGYGTDYLTNSIHSFSNQGKLVKTYSDKTAFPAGVFKTVIAFSQNNALN